MDRTSLFGLLLCVLISQCALAAGGVLPGAGTEASPYLIEDVNDFDAFANPANAATYWAAGVHTKLMTNIDLSGKTMSPIGNAGSYFKGSFDGNYHTILNLKVSSSIREHVGLFGLIWPTAEPGTVNCLIKNLGLVSPEVITAYDSYNGSCAGALVGKAQNYGDNKVIIENCYVEGGSVEGYGGIGGLIGYGECDVIQCYSNISVIGEYTVGGLVGYGAIGSNFDQCYSLGSVSGTLTVGGFAGDLSHKYVGVVSSCYAQGDVDGTDYVGGFVGNNGSMNIFNSYSTGRVTGSGDFVGGFAGFSTGAINCYWDIETSGQVDSSVGQGKTTTEMMSMDTFIGWDCGEAWTIQDGIDYPRLAWEGLSGDPFPQETYSGGDGTLGNPYLISSAQQLNTIRQRYCHLDKSFRLVADINMNDLVEDSFEPIGSVYPFVGTFDGYGHSISNLKYFLYTDLFSQNAGLFAIIGTPSHYANLTHTEIHHLTIINPNVAIVYTGSNPGSFCYAGSLAGQVNMALVHDVNVINANILSEAGSAGGLVGKIENYGDNYLTSNITCSGKVTASIPVGGLVGSCNYGQLTDSSFSGQVSGSDRVGGLAGWYRGNIDQCYSEGSILGATSVGGLVGMMDGLSTVENSYSHCKIEGVDNVGGFCGKNYRTDITNCYSTGLVIGTGSNIGGFIGYHDLGYQSKYPSSFNACFWDTETSETTDGVGFQYPDPVGVTGKTTAEMQTQSTFTGWDFTTPVWMMLREGEDYPRLAWQEVFSGDIAGLYGADMVDFVYLANYWGQDCDCPECDRADIDTSGDVGLGDLAAVANDWLK